MQARIRSPRRSDACILLIQLVDIFWPFVWGSLYVDKLCNTSQYLYQLLVFNFGIYNLDYLIYACNGYVKLDECWRVVDVGVRDVYDVTFLQIPGNCARKRA
jgi:hypothetical protein